MSLLKKPKKAAPGSVSDSSAVASSDSCPARLSRIASNSASLVGKCRLTVPVPTPARRAISWTGTDSPSVANACMATARIRARLRRASARSLGSAAWPVCPSFISSSCQPGLLGPAVAAEGGGEPGPQDGLDLLGRDLGAERVELEEVAGDGQPEDAAHGQRRPQLGVVTVAGPGQVGDPLVQEVAHGAGLLPRGAHRPDQRAGFGRWLAQPDVEDV